jgi:hypothetical protein
MPEAKIFQQPIPACSAVASVLLRAQLAGEETRDLVRVACSKGDYSETFIARCADKLAHRVEATILDWSSLVTEDELAKIIKT